MNSNVILFIIINCYLSIALGAEWTDTTWSQYSYMARVHMERGDSVFNCGGSIIATNEYNGKGVILTAAHCVINGDNIIVRIGCTRSDCWNNGVKEYNDDHYVIHPLYDGSNHDIALIFLKEAITNSNAKRVSLYPNINILSNNEPIRVLGYGGSCPDPNNCLGGSDTDTLEYADTHFMPTSECYQWFKDMVDGPEDFCIKDDDTASQSVCSGDSGSPLMYQNMQIGLVSWSLAHCDVNIPQVATSIPYYYDWIANQCPECVLNHWPSCGTNCLVNYNGCPNNEPCHQVIGAIYEVNDVCYKALTGCYGCLHPLDVSGQQFPAALQKTDCSPHYDYPSCKPGCLNANGDQVKDRVYEINGVCYTALTECNGCLDYPSSRPTDLLQTQCRAYKYPDCSPNCLTDYGGCTDGIACHQVIDRVYEVNGVCYLALTNCIGCLSNPGVYPQSLRVVECSGYESGRSFLGHSLSNQLAFGGDDDFNNYYGLSDTQIFFVVLIMFGFTMINFVICCCKKQSEYKTVGIKESDDEV